MKVAKKPHLVVPKLIEQPTWGGKYILDLKKWSGIKAFKNLKIGQSYEFFGDSKLLLHVTDSSSSEFLPEKGWSTTREVESPYKKDEYISLSSLINNNSEALGKSLSKIKQNALLIKLNQAFGNSFQIHVKPGTQCKWKPKPESWYFLEDGYITLGLKKGTDLSEYKKTCELVVNKMRELSSSVLSKEMTVDQARQKAKEYIKKHDPHNFVNLYHVKKYEVIDLSEGGVHHSWEEDKKNHPLGNVVYEVQVDVLDSTSTLRSFDQGKIKDNGTIRELQIDEYFKHIETNEKKNKIENLRKSVSGNTLLRTPYYNVDLYSLREKAEFSTNSIFHHLFVRDGEVNISGPDGSVHLTRGHSCFIPAHTGTYSIEPLKESVIVKTTL